MNSVKIITDSTCDLSLETLKQLDIEMLPLNVIIGGETYKDCIDLNTKKLFELVEEKKELPKTSAISIGDFFEVFKKYVDEGFDIIFMGIDSKISSTFATALSVSKEFPDRVYALDSVNLSSAIGLQLLKMAKMRDNGLSAKEIVDKILEITPKVQCSFVIKTMDYLYKGGRCSGMKYFAGKILHIHPIIRMENGELIVHRTPRGKMYKALDVMINEFKAVYEAGNVDLDHVMITHACADEYCEYVFNRLSEFMDSSIIMCTTAGCVIGAHCGPGTIGILYISK